jgi:hypothetical protein
VKRIKSGSPILFKQKSPVRIIDMRLIGGILAAFSSQPGIGSEKLPKLRKAVVNQRFLETGPFLSNPFLK